MKLQENGTTAVEINPEATPLSQQVDIKIAAGASEALDQKILGRRIEKGKLNLISPDVTDDVLEKLKSLTNLTQLSLCHTKISDEG